MSAGGPESHWGRPSAELIEEGRQLLADALDAAERCEEIITRLYDLDSIEGNGFDEARPNRGDEIDGERFDHFWADAINSTAVHQVIVRFGQCAGYVHDIEGPTVAALRDLHADRLAATASGSGAGDDSGPRALPGPAGTAPSVAPVDELQRRQVRRDLLAAISRAQDLGEAVRSSYSEVFEAYRALGGNDSRADMDTLRRSMSFIVRALRDLENLGHPNVQRSRAAELGDGRQALDQTLESIARFEACVRLGVRMGAAALRELEDGRRTVLWLASLAAHPSSGVGTGGNHLDRLRRGLRECLEAVTAGDGDEGDAAVLRLPMGR